MMMPDSQFGLSAEDLAALRKVFGRFREIERVTIYGSRAKGTHRRGSDIDLTLHGEKLKESDLGNLDCALQDLLLPYTVDLSLFSSIENPDLLSHIQRCGQVFYRRSAKI